MIPMDLRDKLKVVKNLRVENTSKTRYTFDSGTNILYIPITETNFNGMFQYLNNLEEINLCIDNEIEDIDDMFDSCYNLKHINFIKKLNLEKIYDLSCMFYECTSLEKIDLSNVITSNKLKDLTAMFHECNYLKEVTFGDNFHSENVTRVSGMFFHCYNLEIINWKEHQLFGNLTFANNLFDGCEKLNQIDLRGVNFNNLEDLRHMFNDTNPGLKVLVNNTFKY